MIAVHYVQRTTSPEQVKSSQARLLQEGEIDGADAHQYLERKQLHSTGRSARCSVTT